MAPSRNAVMPPAGRAAYAGEPGLPVLEVMSLLVSQTVLGPESVLRAARCGLSELSCPLRCPRLSARATARCATAAGLLPPAQVGIVGTDERSIDGTGERGLASATAVGTVARDVVSLWIRCLTAAGDRCAAKGVWCCCCDDCHQSTSIAGETIAGEPPLLAADSGGVDGGADTAGRRSFKTVERSFDTALCITAGAGCAPAGGDPAALPESRTHARGK